MDLNYYTVINFIAEIKLNNKIPEAEKLLIQKPKIELHLKEDEHEFIAWGDPIMDAGFEERLSRNLKPEFIINNLYGHYYFLLHDKIKDILYAGNSMFSILPLYYNFNDGKLILSDNAIKAAHYLGLNKTSKRFVIETVLFNYPLFNNSIYEDIKLLPSNSYLLISGEEVKVFKHTCIEQWFELKPVPWKKVVSNICDIFLGSIEKYLPDQHYAHSLTGGLDSRTLVSAGLYYGKKFSCYSFGTHESKDIQIALKLSSFAEIPFINIALNEGYVKGESLGNGREFIENSSGKATFARAHYLYAAKILSENFNHIVTGNFGSEVFRAVHIAGVVISSNLFRIFYERKADKAWEKIEESEEFKCINKNIFKVEIEELKSDILKLPCYSREYSELTKNQQFYVFVFEELFRKYFGAEMVNQFKYIKNRTPFLDIDFLKELLKTELAGIHSEFFEHNPLKRYKGQVLYAHLIKKAYPGFGKIVTDKGYCPEDLIKFSGKINIAAGYLKKNLKKSKRTEDPYSVMKSWENNKKIWFKTPINSELYDLNKINDKINKEILFKILSISYIIEKHLCKVLRN